MKLLLTIALFVVTINVQAGGVIVNSNGKSSPVDKLDSARIVFKLEEDSRLIKFKVAEPSKMGGEWNIATMKGPKNQLSPEFRQALDLSVQKNAWQKVNRLSK